MNAQFVCPLCKGHLSSVEYRFQCPPCERTYAIEEGIPDFFMVEDETEFVDERNSIWEDPEIIEIRNIYYSYCYRELKGMRYCLDELAAGAKDGLRILEVGTGTGHFTRLLDERLTADHRVYSFDSSWGILEKARENTADTNRVILFRANSRSKLPFPDHWFDVIFDRLAPLGSHDVPVLIAGKELLKPDGLYMQAGKRPVEYETHPVDWAKQCGYKTAEYHVWRYPRAISWEEHCAALPEEAILRKDMAVKDAKELYRRSLSERPSDTVVQEIHENALFAHLL